MRLLFALPVVVFAGLAGVFGFYLFQATGGRDMAALPSALIDRPVPAFALPPIEGRADGFAAGDLGGEVKLVNVFASWCLPCRIEAPALERLAEQGVPIYGINIRDEPEDALAFLAEFGDPFRKVGADRDGRAALDWGVYGYPETFVVDAEGRIRYRHVGAILPHQLEEEILPLVRSLQR